MFPAIFYIPKFFEVNSHYEEIDVKREIDCGKYLRIGQMLNNSRLRPHIIRNITVDEVVYLENLAVACKEGETVAALDMCDSSNVRGIVIKNKRSRVATKIFKRFFWVGLV